VLIPARNSEIIAERIPGASYHAIQDAGHAFFNQYPDEFIRIFVPFARDHAIA
jgi:pimeloyl-ACP methyl ester carboxylesterase